MEIRDFIKEDFFNTPLGESFFKIWDNLSDVFEKDEPGITGVKAATVLTFEILQKLADGKNPREITAAEWKNIAEKVLDRAVFREQNSYTAYVFSLYVSCFTGFADRAKADVPPKKIDAVVALAEEIREKTVRFKNEQITEEAYIRDCLWIALDATVKMLSCYAYLFLDERKAEFIWATTAFAFELGRCTVYRREQELVCEFLQAQHRADRELAEEYNLFLADLEKQSQEFAALIDNAFAPDFRERFAGSVTLALSAGVREEEILKTEAEIDDYFLG